PGEGHLVLQESCEIHALEVKADHDVAPHATQKVAEQRGQAELAADALVVGTFARHFGHGPGHEASTGLGPSGAGGARVGSALPTGLSESGRLSAGGPGQASAPWHFLYFLPEPQWHGSLRPILGPSRRTGGPLICSPSTKSQRLPCLRNVADSRWAIFTPRSS